MSATRTGGLVGGAVVGGGTALPFTGLNLFEICLLGALLLMAGFVLLQVAAGRRERGGDSASPTRR